MAVLSAILHATQILLGIYAAVLSYSAIIRLQQYESATQRAAKYSSTASDQLYKTRTTQGSGVVAVLFGLLAAVYLLYAPPADSSSTQPLVLSLVNAAATSSTNLYIGGFWKGSARVPGATDYNDAVRATERLRQSLLWLFGTWSLCVIWYAWAGYSV